MDNIFTKIEEDLFFDESIIFDKEKIKGHILDYIVKEINTKPEKERGFFFEEIVYDFFDYKRIPILKTKKTRDFGIDGVITLKLDIIGDIKIGIQTKYKIIDSKDIDSFLISLKNAELQLGTIICKDSRRLDKYNLNSRIKSILFSKGIETKEKLINKDVDINPVFILKTDDLIEMVASEIRAVATGIYKR